MKDTIVKDMLTIGSDVARDALDLGVVRLPAYHGGQPSRVHRFGIPSARVRTSKAVDIRTPDGFEGVILPKAREDMAWREGLIRAKTSTVSRDIQISSGAAATPFHAEWFVPFSLGIALDDGGDPEWFSHFVEDPATSGSSFVRRWVFRLRSRWFPSRLFELVAEAFSGTPHMRLELRSFQAPLAEQVDRFGIGAEVTLCVKTASGTKFAPKIYEPVHTADGWSSSHVFWLYVDPDPNLAAEDPVGIAVFRDWDGSHGPWDVLPDVNDYDPGKYGLAMRPGSVGDQPDFSSVVLSGAVDDPRVLKNCLEVSRAEESSRPTHYRNAGGGLIRSRDKLWLWDGEIFRLSPDGAGRDPSKPAGDRRGWHGRDVAHFSVNYITTAAMMSADPWAVAECAHLVEQWLGMYQEESGHPLLDGYGAPREIGRSFQAAVMLWKVTGDLRIVDRLAARVLMLDQEQTGQVGWTGHSLPSSEVRPLRGYAEARDLRKFGGTQGWWTPWEEAIAVRGMDAVVQSGMLSAASFGWEEGLLRDVRDVVCATTILHGIQHHKEQGVWGVPNAVGWDGTGDVGADVEWPTNSDGTDSPLMFVDWMRPVLKIAQREDIHRHHALIIEDLWSQGGLTPRAAEWSAVR